MQGHVEASLFSFYILPQVTLILRKRKQTKGQEIKGKLLPPVQ